MCKLTLFYSWYLKHFLFIVCSLISLVKYCIYFEEIACEIIL